MLFLSWYPVFWNLPSLYLPFYYFHPFWRNPLSCSYRSCLRPPFYRYRPSFLLLSALLLSFARLSLNGLPHFLLLLHPLIVIIRHLQKLITIGTKDATSETLSALKAAITIGDEAKVRSAAAGLKTNAQKKEEEQKEEEKKDDTDKKEDADKSDTNKKEDSSKKDENNKKEDTKKEDSKKQDTKKETTSSTNTSTKKTQSSKESE